MLSLPNFSKQFIVETDATGSGLGVVLMQEGKPMAYFSKAILGRALGRSSYKRELMAIVHSVHQWRNYLLGRRFGIRTDHSNLKYILEQRIAIMDQQRWIAKLMGYDYEIKNWLGRENKAADAVSRMHGEVSAITYQQPTWLEEIRNEALHDPKLSSIKEAMQKGTQCAGVVRYISTIYFCDKVKGTIHISKNK